MIGVIVSGVGVAAHIPVRGLRFEPWPGTLNVTATEASNGEPDGVVEPWPGGPIGYRYGTISGIDVAVLGAANIEPGWSLEVVAPVHLRSALGLSDGDRVEIAL